MTSILPGGAGGRDARDVTEGPASWHAGLDFGLLVLRIIAGGVLMAHGFRHLFGWFGGMGIDRFARFVSGLGYQHGTVFANITGWTELVGGAFLVLGLFTPLAAAALLGLLVNAIIAVKFGHGFFGPRGFEMEVVLAGAVFALLFTGSGRVALDNGRRWFRYAPAFGFLFLLISAASTLVVLLVFRHH